MSAGDVKSEGGGGEVVRSEGGGGEVVRSEDELCLKWDRCVADTLIKTGEEEGEWEGGRVRKRESGKAGE